MKARSASPIVPAEQELKQRIDRSTLKVDRLSFLNILYHPAKLHEYVSTGDAFPLHMLLGLTDYCNHDCLWCYTAYTTHDNRVMELDGSFSAVKKSRDERVIDTEVLLRFFGQARDRGLRGVTLVGSGEPLLHPRSAEIMRALGEMGIDLGIITNGNRMTDAHFEVLLEYGAFIRFSLDAADAETYQRLHGKGAVFEQTLDNVARLVARRRELGRRLPTIGAQYVTSQLNADGMIPFAEQMREMGLDYVAYKPMYDNALNPERAHNTLSIEEAQRRLAEVKGCESPSFTIYDKEGKQFEEAWSPRGTNGATYYDRCMGHQFSCALYASGDVYLCVNLAGRKEFLLGNIYELSLEEIWRSERRRQAIASIDLCGKCPAGCHLDPLNKIVWDITHPDPEIHPNFL